MRWPARLPAVLCAAPLLAFAATDEGWPQIPLPEKSISTAIGDALVVNGRPSRIQRFEVDQPEEQVRAFFRERLAQQWPIERSLGPDHLVAARQGRYLITLKLHALGSSTTQGTIAISPLDGKPVGSPVLSDTRQMLPPEAKALTTMMSEDGPRHQVMLTARTDSGVARTSEQLLQSFAQRGFRVVRTLNSPEGERQTAYYELASRQEEATLSVSDQGRFRGIVVQRIREAR